ncbi:uncharacterized protein IUM83_01971 [Phytophthora cinnamomi]|uniref:uncharacterized protein n=1 Tax=Phytophthora cinnamomi TaxID=4785 RepID=UPI00355A955E|nr:hypothetical protein IUM83_01971 [Phytophthora cinnamomi]
MLPHLEERWGFLRPWCSKLSSLGLITYKATEAEGLLWHPKQRVLRLIRETLALLAAVEHIDHVAWRFLLEEHCEVPLDEEGFEIFEDKIPVRFEVILDSRVERDLMTAQNLNRHKVIAYQALNISCGLSQRERVSQAYVTYLSRIAAMGAQPDDQTANYRCRTEEDVTALLQLLETNRTLEYLEVVAPLEYDSYFDEFRAYHLQAMWAPRETLSLENKAAFLSVVSVRKAFTETSTKRSRQGSPRANGPVNEFDQLVLSKIFGFAADPVIRRVYFHRDIIRENCRFFQMAL